jgi:hypothetical protein
MFKLLVTANKGETKCRGQISSVCGFRKANVLCATDTKVAPVVYSYYSHIGSPNFMHTTTAESWKMGKGKGIPVAGRGSLPGCEKSRFQHGS